MSLPPPSGRGLPEGCVVASSIDCVQRQQGAGVPELLPVLPTHRRRSRSGSHRRIKDTTSFSWFHCGSNSPSSMSMYEDQALGRMQRSQYGALSFVSMGSSGVPLLISGSKVRVLDGPPILTGSSRAPGLPVGASCVDLALNFRLSGDSRSGRRGQDAVEPRDRASQMFRAEVGIAHDHGQ
jgi:hypothetical protein